jgi:hypothetical protein
MARRVYLARCRSGSGAGCDVAGRRIVDKCTGLNFCSMICQNLAVPCADPITTRLGVERRLLDCRSKQVELLKPRCPGVRVRDVPMVLVAFRPQPCWVGKSGKTKHRHTRSLVRGTPSCAQPCEAGRCGVDICQNTQAGNSLTLIDCFALSHPAIRESNSRSREGLNEDLISVSTSHTLRRSRVTAPRSEAWIPPARVRGSEVSESRACFLETRAPARGRAIYKPNTSIQYLCAGTGCGDWGGGSGTHVTTR